MKKIINLLKKILSIFSSKKPLKYDNFSMVSETLISPLKMDIKSAGLYHVDCSVFNTISNELEKISFDLNYDIDEILDVTPFGFLALSNGFKVVQIDFIFPLNTKYYIMNTEDFPVTITKDQKPVYLSVLKDLYDSRNAEIIKTNIMNLNILEKNILKQPIVNDVFLKRNENYLSSIDLLFDFNKIESFEINSLSDSLVLLDNHINKPVRTFGHRWSKNQSSYISNSKLSELDRGKWEIFNNWTNYPHIWEIGQIALIKKESENILIEVVSMSEDCVYFVNRKKALSLLEKGLSKEEAMLKSQDFFNIKNINKYFIFKN